MTRAELSPAERIVQRKVAREGSIRGEHPHGTRGIVRSREDVGLPDSALLLEPELRLRLTPSDIRAIIALLENEAAIKGGHTVWQARAYSRLLTTLNEGITGA